VVAAIDRDPAMETDRMTSMILDYGGVHAVGTCSTQMVPFQRIQLLGTRGRVEIRIPFNAPPDRPCQIVVDTGADPFGGGETALEFPVCDQYTLQGDLFSRAILEGAGTPEPLEDAVANMTCIDALFRSAETGKWESVGGSQ
jgi:predicted dehydrogenase